jgi:hypothetical protein
MGVATALDGGRSRAKTVAGSQSKVRYFLHYNSASNKQANISAAFRADRRYRRNKQGQER